MLPGLEGHPVNHVFTKYDVACSNEYVGNRRNFLTAKYNFQEKYLYMVRQSPIYYVRANFCSLYNSCNFLFAYILKLDGVGRVNNRSFANKLHLFVRIKK